MARSRPIRWLVALGLPLITVLALSLWAIDKPNVVWRGEPSDPSTLRPACPLCRSELRMYASRCPTCDQDVEWVVAPKEDSPICAHCLSAGEAEALTARRRALGEEVAAARVAKALAMPPASARIYLATIRPGRCGWCGGTGADPSPDEGAGGDCPVCFGEKDCIACDGDRRIVVGTEAADLRLRRYQRVVSGLGSETPVARARAEVREANEDFLSRHSGTAEAQAVLFWPAYREKALEPAAALRGALGFENQPLAVVRARERCLRVFEVLKD